MLSPNLESLHSGEEILRQKALLIIQDDKSLSLHIPVIQESMNLADLLRQYETEDEDFKVIQFLGMRTFNAYGAALKLCLSGYFQNAALILRDVLETTFLLDLFRSDPFQITRWRLANESARRREFKPVRVRTLLDKRDGFTGAKRAELYNLFSELAGHPTMRSVAMLKPKGMDAIIGPFMDESAMRAVLSEMARLATQTGDTLNRFFPSEWSGALRARMKFERARIQWFSTVYATPKS